ARPLADEGLALARAGGDAWTTAELLNDVGLSSDRDEPDRALRASAESLELRRRLGSEFDVADSLNNLGYMLAYTGRTNEARNFLDEGPALAERIGDMRHVALLLGTLGLAGLFGHRYDEAQRHFAECLRVSRTIGDQRVPLEAIRGIAAIAAERGEIEEAARLVAAVEALHHSYGGTPSGGELQMEELFTAPAWAAVDRDAWARAAERGERLTLAEAIAAALATAGEAETPPLGSLS